MTVERYTVTDSKTPATTEIVQYRLLDMSVHLCAQQDFLMHNGPLRLRGFLMRDELTYKATLTFSIIARVLEFRDNDHVPLLGPMATSD